MIYEYIQISNNQSYSKKGSKDTTTELFDLCVKEY